MKTGVDRDSVYWGWCIVSWDKFEISEDMTVKEFFWLSRKGTLFVSLFKEIMWPGELRNRNGEYGVYFTKTRDYPSRCGLKEMLEGITETSYLFCSIIIPRKHTILGKENKWELQIIKIQGSTGASRFHSFKSPSSKISWRIPISFKIVIQLKLMIRLMLSKSGQGLVPWQFFGWACSHGIWNRPPLFGTDLQILLIFDNVTVVNEDILKVDLAQHIQSFKIQTYQSCSSQLALLHYWSGARKRTKTRCA